MTGPSRNRLKEIENAARNRRELIEAKLDRRELFKLGLLTGAGYLVAKRGLSARAVLADDDGGGQPKSPPTTPFVEPLPIPPIKQPATGLNPEPTIDPNTAAGEARTRFHQAFARFPPQVFYEIHVREEKNFSFHPELPPQTIWGHDGMFPGPTIVANYGTPILVRRYNDLPADHVGFGIPEVTTHLHNGHTPSESDGFPTDFYGSGLFYDHHYPMVYAGANQFPPTGDPREFLGTLWYHDHRVSFTAQNTYKGLDGFQIHYNELDSGDENDEKNPNVFHLPSHEFDVPLLFADKVFDSNGQLFFDMFNFDGILGDKFTVNGKIQPFFQVHPRKYRFRCLNGGPSRFYQFSLTNLDNLAAVYPFTLIANENLLQAPLTVNSIRISVAERNDIIIDFSQFAPGTSVHLENRLQQTDGRGPTGKILPAGQGNLVLRFDVVLPDVGDSPPLPTRLIELPPINLNAKKRSWEFNRSDGAWQINDRFFDVRVSQASVPRDSEEIWVLKNGGGGWSHPIHVHQEESRLISRNGRSPQPREVCMKDVFELRPDETVTVFRRMRDFVGRYPIHCHNTVHEDHAMMARWDIVEEPGAPIVE